MKRYPFSGFVSSIGRLDPFGFVKVSSHTLIAVSILGWFCFFSSSSLSSSAYASGDPKGFSTVIIDPGHGGHDRGGVPGQGGIAEKIATLDTAQRLAKDLRTRGIKVIMTRTDDTFIPLGRRVAYTSGGGSRTVFVSIHFNSAPRHAARGIETYYYRPDSFGLATRLHRSLVNNIGADDRRLRRRGFYVIRNAHIPAVLCECGFLTNGSEERLIAGQSYRQKLADSIADGLVQQRLAGNPRDLGAPPPISYENLAKSHSKHRSRRTAWHRSHSGSQKRIAKSRSSRKERNATKTAKTASNKSSKKGSKKKVASRSKASRQKWASRF